MKRRIKFRPVFLTFFYQCILLLWTGVFFITLADIFSIGKFYALILAAVLLGLDLCLSVAWFLVEEKYSQWRVRFYYAINAYLGIGNFMVLASLLYWLIKAYNNAGLLGLPMYRVGILLLLAALAIGLYGIWNSYRLKVITYTVAIANLPKFWHGKKVVMAADQHLGNIRDTGFASKVAEIIRQQNPDMVLIPGDYFDGTPGDLASLTAPLENIRPKFGIYFCDGNHEAFRHDVPFVHALEKAGVTILNNDFVDIEGLQIIGVDFLSTHGLHKLREVLQKLDFDRNKPSILIRHVPSSFKAAHDENISLMLCGHTHRAQTFPFNLVTKIIFEGFDYGYKFYKSMQVITTSGAGTWGPPQRVGTSSEIVSIILLAKE